MRILVINYEYPPVGAGGGDASKFLAEGYARQGHDVKVLTAHWRGLPRVESINPYLTIHRIRAFRRDADRCTPARMAAFMLLGMPAAWRLARSWKPDIIHCHFAIPVGPVALAVKKMQGIPYVVTFQGGDVPGFVPGQTKKYFRLIGPLARKVVNQASRAIAVSEGLAEMARRDFAREDISCIPNGVDVTMFKPGVDKAKNGPVRICFAGRFNPQKGLHRLIDAAAKLQREDAGDFEVKIYGGGPLESTLKGQVEALGLSRRVSFPGWIDREKLAVVLGDSHVFVMPSDIEGMPLACLQAMAAGCAVVGSRTVGIEEAVSDGVSGYLVPVGDVSGLAGAMARLVSEPSRARAMGEAGRRIAVEHYSWDVIVEQYLRLFDSILSDA